MNRITLRAGVIGALASFAFLAVACAEEPTTPLAPADAAAHQGGGHGSPGGEAELGSPIFDIAALPNGGIVFAEFTTLKELTRRGAVREILTVPTVPSSAVNGIAPIGSRSFWVTSAGLDLAVGAGLWRVSNGSARLVGDIKAFEIAHDPDANVGTGWKVPACEEAPPDFSEGPQSNPYHLESLGGDVAIVADAAGNSVLRGHAGGALEVVAVLEPPTDENGDWHILKTLDDDTECYVQPVPTAVAAGPDHSLYVSELTGAPGPGMVDGIQGEARIWRVNGDAVNATCPSSDQCDLAVSGLTSVIDIDFGGDGLLYAVEYDANGWLQAAVLGNGAGGSILACDVVGATGPLTREDCDIIAEGLVLPGAITFDRHGTLWVAENHLGIGSAPSIHTVAMP